MSNLNTREEKLKLVFAAHPQAKEIYMTSDDRAFFDEHNAEAYAQGLKDQEVKRFEREQEEGRPETDASTSSATDAPVAEAPVAEAPVEEAPVAEAPVTDAPVEEAPVAEEKPKSRSKAKSK